MTSWSIRTSPAVLVPSLARTTRLPWLFRSLLHHAASARRGQNRVAAAGDLPLRRCRARSRKWQRPFARVDLPSRRRLDRDHLEGVHVAVFAADRDIFAVAKRVVAEAIAGLVVVLRGLVVVEHPARVLGAAELVDEAAEFVVLTIPESTHAAMLAVFPPKVDIDASIGIERSDEFIAMLVRARGKFLRAGEIEPDALEHVRQLGHDGLLDRAQGP